MTLNDFIKTYDVPGAVILLEGKRNVLEEDKEKLRNLGKILTLKTQYILFRSGNADGSDYYFSQGVSAIDSMRLQVITPYTSHRKKYNVAGDTVSLDDINMLNEPEAVYQSKMNKKTNKLVDQYVSGDRNRYSIKAAYIIRDTIKVLGTDSIPPATFGIFYDDLEKPKSGGTGHTMNVCEKNNIELISQDVWFDWLKEQ